MLLQELILVPGFQFYLPGKVFFLGLCFQQECLILVKGEQNNTLHFYHLHKLLFPKNASDWITLNVSIFNRRVTNNMQIQSEIVSKFSNALKLNL